MKQHNYAVDLSNFGNATKQNFNFALKNIAEECDWKQLNFNPTKIFFRFKLISDSKDISNNNNEIYAPGFYYWSSDSMKDTDYQYININEAISLLRKIDKSEFEKTLVDGQPLAMVNSTTFKIACRHIKIVDYNIVKQLMKKYDIDTLEIGSNGNNFVFNEENNKSIDKFLKSKGK